MFDISRELADVMPAGWKVKLRTLVPKDAHFRVINGRVGSPYLAIGAQWREPKNIGIVRKLLASGLFPLWKVSEVTERTYPEWMQAKKSVEKFRGRVLVEK